VARASTTCSPSWSRTIGPVYSCQSSPSTAVSRTRLSAACAAMACALCSTSSASTVTVTAWSCQLCSFACGATSMSTDGASVSAPQCSRASAQSAQACQDAVSELPTSPVRSCTVCAPVTSTLIGSGSCPSSITVENTDSSSTSTSNVLRGVTLSAAAFSATESSMPTTAVS